MAEAQSPGRELPPDIIFYNILPRLPAKSLLRFKCVSKQWHSFLKTPLFAQLQLHHATNEDHQTNLKILVFSNKIRRTFKVIDREALEDGLTASRPFPFKADSVSMNILASFGGLVCVGIIKWTNHSARYSDLILWNPLTGDYKTLSKVNSHDDYCFERYHQRAFGLYYSSCGDDFKLLCVTHYLNVYIYSLKSDAWRKIDSSTEDLKRIAAYPCLYAYLPYRLWPSIALNENLYFLKYGDDNTRNSIIRFDTKTEKFKEIATPCFDLGNQYDVFLSFAVLRGCIHFFVIYCTNSDLEWHVECWWMDEDENWIKEVNLPKASYIIEPLKVVSEGLQLIPTCNDNSVYKLDLTAPIFISRPWTPDRSKGIYIETLVSPNRSRLIEDRHEEQVKQNGLDFLRLKALASGLVGWVF